ncbi:MAG: TetR/AcrR family transcriptional regulator [Rhodospirillales bacterium]|nr:TetR/AcrR family transcriptional regulator [Rhodospirillales bacterium]
MPAKPEKRGRTRLAPEARAALILEHALELFASRHYGNVSMRDIAQACNVNVGLIYHYYANKQELLRLVLESTIATLQAEYDAVPILPPSAELKRFLRLHVPMAPTLVKMVKIMSDHAAANSGDTEISAMIDAFYKREQDYLEQCLHRGIADGVFRALDVPATARLFSLQLDGIFYAAQARGDWPIAHDIEALCAVVDSPALSAS